MEEETSEEEKMEREGIVGNSTKSLIFRVGKKIVITGMVLSSAPFVLPPILVVSTIGFAFAVPFGLVFAGYACTEKVMSKLLSRPRVERIEEGEEERDMEWEEEEFEKDTKKTLDMIGDENETGEEEDRLGGGTVRGSEERMKDSVEERDKLVEDEKGVVELEDKRNEGIVVEELVGGTDDKQEEEFEEDMKTKLELRMELIGDENETGEVKAEEENQLGGGMTRGFEEAIEYTDEVIDGNGYKEVCNVEGEDKFVEDVKGVIEEERGNEAIVVEEPEEEKLVREDNGFMRDESIEEREILVEDTPESIEEEGEPVKATKRMIQEYTGEENVDRPMEEEEMKVNEYFDKIDEEEKPVKQNNEVIEADEEVEIPVEETIENLEEENKFVREAEVGEEETADDYILDKSITEEEVPIEVTKLPLVARENEENDDIPVQEEKPLEGTMKGVEENGYTENRVLDEKLKSNEMEGMVEERMYDKEVDDMVEVEEPLVETKEMAEGRRIKETEESMVEEEKPIMERKVVTVILIKDNSREIADESGLDLFDEQHIPEFDETNEYNVSPAVEPYYSSRYVEVYSEPPHESSKLSSTTVEHSLDLMSEENTDPMVRPVFSERTESQPANSASEMKTTNPSKEVLYSEKRIWELIDAMRKIVGYKDDIQPNLSEELKALYIFTGVEPPVPFKDPLDIVEVNDKLRLLMAIIGVK